MTKQEMVEKTYTLVSAALDNVTAEDIAQAIPFNVIEPKKVQAMIAATMAAQRWVFAPLLIVVRDGAYPAEILDGCHRQGVVEWLLEMAEEGNDIATSIIDNGIPAYGINRDEYAQITANICYDDGTERHGENIVEVIDCGGVDGYALAND